MDLRVVFEAAAAAWDSQSAAYLRDSGVVLRNRHLLIRAEGNACVERAVVARVDTNWRVQPGSESAFEVDTLVLDYGDVPCSELSRLSGCTHDRLVPRHDEWMRTDVPGLLVAGDVAGVVGPSIAAGQGRLAGIGVAQAVGKLTPEDADSLAKPIRARLHRLLLDRQRRWSAYRVGCGILDLARPDTVVCHCEDVTAAEVQAAVMGGSSDPAPVRGETRAGMGICQGRDCARQIEALVARAAHVRSDRIPPLSVRPPVVPIPLGAIAERPLELV